LGRLLLNTATDYTLSIGNRNNNKKREKMNSGETNQNSDEATIFLPARLKNATATLKN
jgi:hypothetical protein